MSTEFSKFTKILPLICIMVCIVPGISEERCFGQEPSATHVIRNSFDSDSVRIVIRGDDIGFTSAANSGCIRAYQAGILTSTEVMACCPWFLDAARLLRENPALDVGVHLTLTSEFENYKWGPITNAPSLVTEDGYFPVSNSGFVQLDYSLEEVEQELRAQIELALRYIPHVSHLSVHMGAPTYNAELSQIVQRLSQEYGLPLGPTGVTQWISNMWGTPANQKEDYLADTLNRLGPGLYVFVCHPALNNQETQSVEGSGDDASVRMAVHRGIVTDILTGDRIKQIIQEQRIHLISYADTYVPPILPNPNGPIEITTTGQRFDSVQVAVDYAFDGDEIVLSPGTYQGSIDLMNKALVIRSFEPANPAITEDIIIAGNPGEPVITRAQNVSLEGLSIVGGSVGVICEGTLNSISNCRFVQSQGDGICVPPGAHLSINNTIIAANGSTGIKLLATTGRNKTYGSCEVINCTIVQNQGYAISDGEIIVANSILYFNGQSVNGIQVGNIDADVSFSDVQGGFDGDGNIDVDPLFVDAGNGDYHLRTDSPCIDAGDPDDPLGNEPEPNGSRINLGAYGGTEEASKSNN